MAGQEEVDVDIPEIPQTPGDITVPAGTSDFGGQKVTLSEPAQGTVGDDNLYLPQAESLQTTQGVNAEQAKGVRIYSNGHVELGEAKYYERQGSVFSGAKGVKSYDDYDTAAYAESFKKGLSSGTYATQTTLRRTSISSEAVDTLILNNGGMAFKKLKNIYLVTESDGQLKTIEAKSSINNNELSFLSRSSGLITFKANDSKKFKLEFNGPETKLIFDKDIIGDINKLAYFAALNNDAILNTYKVGKKTTVHMENINLGVKNFNFNEQLISNSPADVIYTNEQGLEFMEVQPGAEYQYFDITDPGLGFGVLFDDNMKVQVKKSIAQEDYSDINGRIDLIDKSIVLEGRVKFKKYIDGVYKTIFETDNDYNKLSLKLKDDKVDAFELSASVSQGITRTYAGSFNLDEEVRTNSTHRLLMLRPLLQESVNPLLKYSTNFVPSTPDIVFINGMLKQGNVQVIVKSQDAVLKELSTERYELYLDDNI